MDYDSDLFAAILSMDAYDRGYHAGISGLSVDDNKRLGKATLLTDAHDQISIDNSFYATAWRVPGRDYIAYRGTDVGDIFASPNDIWGGWSIGLGFSAGTQADLAAKFYEEILAARTSPPSPTSVFAPAPADIHLTGHSLGGGLAE